MKKICWMIWLAALLTVAASCRKPDGPVDELLRLRHKGADMPIWVHGNLDSRKIVLFLHGGPGECALCLRSYFTRAEEKVAMAYWDQRMAGSASGNTDPATLNYPQFAEDLRLVVQLLKQQYPDVEIYLLGHSFGVEMAWQFLTTGQNQDLVAGFIAVNGTFATYNWLQQVQKWVLDEAARQGDTEALDYMRSIALTRDNMAQTVQWGEWYSRMFRLGANPVWPSDDKGYNWRLWFGTPHSKPSQITNIAQYDAYYAREIFTFDRREQLKDVRIPIALFWGAKDGIMPLAHAQETREQLSVPCEWVVFEQSWHSPFHTENEKFTEALLQFVE